MKALVILQTILEDEEYEDMECVACGFTKTYLEKAIAELEDMVQPKIKCMGDLCSHTLREKHKAQL